MNSKKHGYQALYSKRCGKYLVKHWKSCDFDNNGCSKTNSFPYLLEIISLFYYIVGCASVFFCDVYGNDVIPQQNRWLVSEIAFTYKVYAVLQRQLLKVNDECILNLHVNFKQKLQYGQGWRSLKSRVEMKYKISWLMSYVSVL